MVSLISVTRTFGEEEDSCFEAEERKRSEKSNMREKRSPKRAALELPHFSAFRPFFRFPALAVFFFSSPALAFATPALSPF